jgi:hypothetical protein
MTHDDEKLLPDQRDGWQGKKRSQSARHFAGQLTRIAVIPDAGWCSTLIGIRSGWAN